MNLIVGIGDMKVSKSPDILTTIGLGSCIGIAIYDPITRIGGLSHIMLPDSSQVPDVKESHKFADLSIPILVDKLQTLGVKRANMRAKIAGGASMFKFSDKTMMMNIGERNSEAVLCKLRELKIPVISIEVGGEKGRTMVLDLDSGVVRLKIVGAGIKEI